MAAILLKHCQGDIYVSDQGQNLNLQFPNYV
jgi:hypothetical protein